ncbi:MAG: 5'/3'-nucleotidase SurE [Bacteroidota bacterium]
MTNKPLILVTNDDGITAPGIRALVSVVAAIGEVVVVAPDSPQSGQGHAITLSDPLRLKATQTFEGVQSWQCSGTPVDAVKLAKSFLLKERTIDLCVSGINHGSNAAQNIIYSGTMSAAMEASLAGIPSIGFSLLDFRWEADFSAAQHFARQIIQNILSKGMPGGCRLLNVNIPALPQESIKGIKVCRQAEARWVEAFSESFDPLGRPYYWLTGEFVNEDKGADSDIAALEAGYVSVVPSGHDLTLHQAIDPLRFLETTS